MICHHCGKPCSIEKGAVIICTPPHGGGYCSWACYAAKKAAAEEQDRQRAEFEQVRANKTTVVH